MNRESDQFEIDVCESQFDIQCYIEELNKRKIYLDPSINLVKHYCDHGWTLYLNPCRWFSTEFYLKEYIDVVDAKMNPFYHFLVSGEKEGRIPNAYVNKYDSVISILKSQTSLEDEAKTWIKDRKEIIPLTVQKISDTLNFKNAILSISHDFYMKNPGGVQLCIKNEMNLAVKKSIKYIHIFPFQPLPGLNLTNNAGFLIGLSIDGQFLGYAQIRDFFNTLSSKIELNFIVAHSVLGFNLANLGLLIKRTKFEKFFYWAHDYFPFCASWTLMRNKLVFCESPEITSQACSLCYYGKTRSPHLQQFKLFFSYLNVEFIFPSKNVSDNYQLFNKKIGFKITQEHILPHMKMKNLSFIKRKKFKKIKIGFLGHHAYHKGWEEFMIIFYNKSLSKKIDFFHLASNQSSIGLGLNFINVNTTENGLNSMSDAIKENSLDFCFLWPHWPETFGITAIEAVKGGARIITNKKSGNIYETVKLYDVGHSFDNIEELIHWLNLICDTDSEWDKLDFVDLSDLIQSDLTFSI
jgi:hypothetical protein